MRSYQDISSAKSHYSQSSSDKSSILGLPPGYMVGAEVSVTDNVLSVGPLIANISGRQVAIPKTKLLNEMSWEVPRIDNFDYYIYLDSYSIYHVTNLEPVTSDSQYGKYHPIIPNWRYVCKFNIDSDGNISYVISWNAVGSTQIDVGAILARSINANTLNAIFAQFTNIIITTSGFAGYHLAGTLPSVGDSRLILTGDKLALEWITALGSPNTIDNATWVEVIRFGGRDQFNQLGSFTARIFANPSADLSAVPDGDPFPALTGNAEAFRFNGNLVSVAGSETLTNNGMTLDVTEHFVGSGSLKAGDKKTAYTTDYPIDLGGPYTAGVRFRHSARDAGKDLFAIKNSSYSVGVHLHGAIWNRDYNTIAARYGHCSASIGTTVYVLGGVLSAGSTYTDELWAFDTVAKTWTQKASFTTARRFATVVAINGKLYLHGGDYYSVYADVQVYDPAIDSWTTKTSNSVGHSFHTAVAIGDTMVIFGGMTVSDPVNDCWAYDTVNDTWTQKASGATVRWNHAAGVIDGIMYIFGGASPSLLYDVWAYDLSTNTWASKVSNATYAVAAMAFGVANGKLYSFGGNAYKTSVVEYDPVANALSFKSPYTTGRSNFAGAVVDNVLYFSCGGTAAGYVGDMLEYDPAHESLSDADSYYPEIFVVDSTNGKKYHQRLTHAMAAGAWNSVHIAYNPTTHVVTLVLNNVEYVEYELTGAEIPSGGADLLIGDDSMTYITNAYYDDAMYFSGYAWPKSDLFTHYTNGLYWSGVKGISDDKDIVIVPAAGGSVRIIGGLDIDGAQYDTDWHYVGAAGEPAFENSWTNYDAVRRLHFRKDSAGNVFITGVVKSGTANTTTFTLPSGYRPDYLLQPIVHTAAGPVAGTINADGTVVSPNSTWTIYVISFNVGGGYPVQGATGSAGADGADGADGATGATGPMGPATLEYDPAQTYNADFPIWYDGILYVSLQNANTGNQPDTSPEWWDAYVGREIQYVAKRAIGSGSITNNSTVNWVTAATGTFTAYNDSTLFLLNVSCYVGSGVQVKWRIRLSKAGETDVILPSSGIMSFFFNAGGDHQTASFSIKCSLLAALGDWTAVVEFQPAGAVLVTLDTNDEVDLVAIPWTLNLTGPKGNQGDTGPTGPTGPVGVSIVAGAYDAGTTYATGDYVLYSGRTYQSLADSNTGNTPDSSPTYWEQKTYPFTFSSSNPTSGDGVDGDLWFVVEA